MTNVTGEISGTKERHRFVFKVLWAEAVHFPVNFHCSSSNGIGNLVFVALELS